MLIRGFLIWPNSTCSIRRKTWIRAVRKAGALELGRNDSANHRLGRRGRGHSMTLLNNDDLKLPLNDEARFKVEYKEVGDYIRHYSTVRSALTTFLLTAGVATFSAYYHQQQTSPFFV